MIFNEKEEKGKHHKHTHTHTHTHIYIYIYIYKVSIYRNTIGEEHAIVELLQLYIPYVFVLYNYSLYDFVVLCCVICTFLGIQIIVTQYITYIKYILLYLGYVVCNIFSIL